MRIVQLGEDEFRELVFEEHKKGHFRGDPHTMQVKFKLHKNSIGFVAVKFLYDDGEPEPLPLCDVMGFCGMDIYEKDGVRHGFIHCLGVPKEYRRQGLSKLLLLEVEKIAKEQFDIKDINSTCNPISERSHILAGYDVTHPGRLSPSGKRMQIKLKKIIL